MTDWPFILAEHGVTVWRTVYRLLDHHADALDCYQETFLAAWRFAEREPVADWPSLLISLATRRAMDRLRQRYRDRARLSAIDSLREPSSEAECPVRHASARELLDRVREGMAELLHQTSQGLVPLSLRQGARRYRARTYSSLGQGARRYRGRADVRSSS
jgi:DNA-directed RNA polymerase specialized sigma24 family protein